MGNGRQRRRFGEMGPKTENVYLVCVLLVALAFLVAGIVLAFTMPPCGLCCVLPLGIAFVLAVAKHAADLKNRRARPTAS